MKLRYIYLIRNVLKLTYGNLGPKNFFPGVKPPDPHPKGRPRLTRPGRGASNAGGEERGGEERGG